MARMRYRQVSTFYTHTFLASAAKCSLSAAEKTSGDDSRFHCLSSIVFCSFALEALMNHVGQELIGPWEEIERGLSPKGKCLLLSEKIGFDVDFSTAPFQTFDAVFKCRNAFAHGRVLRSHADAIIDFESGEDFPEKDHKQIDGLNVKTATRAVDDTVTVIERMSDAAGLETFNVLIERFTTPLIYDNELPELLNAFWSTHESPQAEAGTENTKTKEEKKWSSKRK